jgi:hypothetical protein
MKPCIGESLSTVLQRGFESDRSCQVPRGVDVIGGAADLAHLYTFAQAPVYMGCVDHGPEEDLHADMRWTISVGSGAVQLAPLLPLATLYTGQHGSGSVGRLWTQHHLEFAAFIAAEAPGVRAVLEVGGAHGILSRETAAALGRRLDWTIRPGPTGALKRP